MTAARSADHDLHSSLRTDHQAAFQAEKLAIARLIINEIAPEATGDTPPAQNGFDYLKSILPQIERITLSDQDLAAVALNGPKS